MPTVPLSTQLAAQFDAVDRLVASASAEDLARRPGPDKWSAREHLAHLVCYQQRFLERLTAILTTERPTFGRYRADDDPDWPAWQGLPAAQLQERFRAGRAELVALADSLTATDTERVGIHPVFGAMTASQWFDFFLIHEGHHAYQMFVLAVRP